MFDEGLINETESVVRSYPDSQPRLEKTIGYGECLDIMNGKIRKDEAIELTTIHTQQYAKRQDTWFRKNSSIIWSKLESAVDDFSFTIDKLNGV